MDIDIISQRAVLTYAVANAIFCSATGQVLDKRNAVKVVVTVEGSKAALPSLRSAVVTGNHFDKIQHDLLAAAKRNGWKVDALDGRVLFG